MKKVFVKFLILCIALCSVLSFFTACNGGENQKPMHNHEFNKQVVKEAFKESDATCTEQAKYYYSCECGEKGDETFLSGDLKEHQYTNWNSSEEVHWKECICGDKSTESEHIFINGVCECGYEKLKEEHVCNYNELKYNAESHWMECSCGNKKGVAPHQWTSVSEDTEMCFDCGMTKHIVKPHEHKFNQLKFNQTEHWYECDCGEKERIALHIPGDEATETTEQTCTECGIIITPALGHVHSENLIKQDAKPQSCTEEGRIEYYVCSCGKWFLDSSATTEITDENSIIVEKDKHKFEQIKYNEIQHWKECECGEVDGLEGHKGGETTCKSKALCQVCNEAYGTLASCVYVNGYCKWCNEREVHLYGREGNYIYFGKYPQSLKKDNVIVSSNKNSNGYYTGSDGEEYAKVVATPFMSTHNKFSNGSKIEDNAVYYFKVEPIKWRILSQQNGTALLLCESIIANGQYDDNSNNYKESTIRQWLNDEFYNTAFSDLAQKIILTTTIDNSVESTGWEENPYVCANTQDKVFLLSRKDISNTSYGFDSEYMFDEAREKTTTDYSRATGAWINLDLKFGNGYWWLRSPHYVYNNYQYRVYSDGKVDFFNFDKDVGGIVPAIVIKLGEPIKFHDFGTLKHNETEHWYECECGEKKNLATHKAGAEATENTDQVCSTCGIVMAPALGHVHDLHLTKVDFAEQSCEKEGNIEYYVCTCGKWFTDNSATIEITDKDSVIIQKDEHDHSKLNYDGENHWRECKCGDKIEIKPHTGGSATCSKRAECDVCRKEYGNFGEHTYKDGWIVTDTHHYKETTCGCNVKGEYKEHSSDGSGFCVCGKAVSSTSGIEYEISSDGTYAIVVDYNGSWTKINIAPTYQNLPVKIIDDDAFCETSIREIIIPASVTNINFGAFQLCKNLQKVTFEENSKLEKIDKYAFYYCESLVNIEIPASVVSICREAFSRCANLQNISFGENSKLIELELSAFNNCDALTYTEIDNLKYMKANDNPYYLLCDVLDTSLSSYKIQEGTKLIGENTFSDCNNLLNLEIPASVITICTNAFSNYAQETALQSVTFAKNSNLQRIGFAAFAGCENLTAIELPAGLKFIDGYAFDLCYSLNKVNYLGTIDQWVEIDFYNYSSNPLFIAKNLYINNVLVKDLKLTTATKIKQFAFYKANCLESVEIPASVTSIEMYAFYYCANLQNVTFAKNAKVTTLGEGAFCMCESLKSIKIPASVTSVEIYAFEYCNDLTDIYCEAQSKPSGWSESWNINCYATVHWNCKEN